MRAARDVDGARRVLAVLELDLEPRGGGVVADGDLELGALAGEHRRGARELDRRAEQVVVAVVHDDEAQARQQERQREAEARAVVQRAEQHREHHRGEHDAEARRQDVDAPALERDGVRVGALAAARPDGGPAFERASDAELHGR